MTLRALSYVTAYATREVPPRDMLLLDRNEGPPPPAQLLDMLDHSVEALTRYPDTRVLEAALARRFGLKAPQVIVTAGADDAIDRCCRAFLAPSRSLVVTEPTFEMLLRYAGLAGAAAAVTTWLEPEFPTRAVLELVDGATGLIAVVSPNNPTGMVLGPGDLARLSSAAGNVPILLDQAYVEYADVDLTPFALRLPNVVVVRTFSKAWGLAGCRVGYALGPGELIRRLRVAGAPYPVAGPSLLLAAARWESGAAAMRDHVARVRRERDALRARLNRAGVPVFPSQANFVLGQFGPRADPIRRALADEGVLVRDFTRSVDGALRISLPGSPKAFDWLMRALDRVLPLEEASP